jgi:hypothetical protein
MKTENYFVQITRPDGQKLYVNTSQVVYVTPDPIDDSGQKTEIVTTEGSFFVKKTLEEVLSVLSGTKRGNL